MKRVLTFIFSAILALSASQPQCEAQNYVSTPVTVSSTTVERDGKVYYEHKVLEKQTLYSISKAYDVYIDEIYAANPGLKENGLKKGSVIYIPVKGDAGVSGDNGANSASLDGGEGVKKGENGAVSGENDANSASLGANASASSDDNNGKVSAKKRKSVEPTEFEKNAAEKKAARKAEKEKRKKCTTHVVKWYETLADISEKYGVPASVIMELNGLTSEELKARQKLLVPKEPEDYAVELPAPEAVEPTPEAPTTETDSTAISSDALTKLTKKRPDFIGKNDICATLLLPFSTAAGGGNELSMDFYSGALLAAKHLSEDSGISLYINVFDSYGDTLPPDSDLNYSDFIVGMLSKNGFGDLLENVPKDCLVVSPLDNSTLPLAEGNANFYQCSNSTAAQYADMAQWLVEDMGEGDRILLIHENSLTGSDQAEEVGEALKACGLEWTTFSYSILEGRNITESLSGRLTGEGVNRVIIATSNEAFANDALRNLNVLIHSDFKIVLYGGSKIRGFDNIPVENLHSVNFHSSLSFYIDYDDPKVQKFLMEYRALFNTEPTQTAFQGYDVMYYFTITTRRVGALHFVERPKNTPMLMSDFEFDQVGKDGGHIRTGIRRTVYEPDYSITYLK